MPPWMFAPLKNGNCCQFVFANVERMSIVAINTTGQYVSSIQVSNLSVDNKSQSTSFEQAFILANSKKGTGVNTPSLNKEAEGKVGINTQDMGIEQTFETFIGNLQSMTQSLQTQAGNELRKEEASSVEERALRIQKELMLIGARINIKGHIAPEKEVNPAVNRKHQKTDFTTSL